MVQTIRFLPVRSLRLSVLRLGHNMYTPSFNRIDDEHQIRCFVAAARTAEFVTVDPDGLPVATLLPIMWDGDTVVAHMARANPQWKSIEPASPVLLICTGPQAYVSPSWYAAKAEHGRVVPTWNYSAVHLSGTVKVHENRDWLRDAVTRLTGMHEHGRSEPWQPSDAPPRYIEGQLAGIVGLEIAVERWSVHVADVPFGGYQLTLEVVGLLV
jgi:transcriptional regulator